MGEVRNSCVQIPRKNFSNFNVACCFWTIGVSVRSAQYLVELSKLFKVSTDFLLGLDDKEVVDISGLAESEKQMIYSMLEYFNNYGKTMREINRQVEEDYDVIKKATDKITEQALKIFWTKLCQ